MLLSKFWKKVGWQKSGSEAHADKISAFKGDKKTFLFLVVFLYPCNSLFCIHKRMQILHLSAPHQIFFWPFKLVVWINSIIHSFLQWQLKKSHSLHHACLQKQSHIFLCVERVITVKVKCMQFPNAKFYREKNTTLLCAFQLAEALSYDRP